MLEEFIRLIPISLILGLLVTGFLYMLLRRRLIQKLTKGQTIACCVALSVAVALLISFERLASAPEIVLINGSGHPIHEIVLSAGPFRAKSAMLLSGESASWRIYPCGEASLSLHFRTEAGMIVSKDEFLYLESGVHTKSLVKVDPECRVSVEATDWQ